MNQHFKTLGLDSSADRNEVKKAFQRLATIYHPDKNPDTESLFERACQAYQALMNYLDQPDSNIAASDLVVQHAVNTDRRFQYRGSRSNRRFETVLEQHYKGLKIQERV